MSSRIDRWGQARTPRRGAGKRFMSSPPGIAGKAIGRAALVAPSLFTAALFTALLVGSAAHAAAPTEATPAISPSSAQPDSAGLATLIYARGPTAVAATSGALRIVGIGSPLQAGDLISTGDESFAIIELADTTRVMLRPDTAVRLAVLNRAAATQATPAHDAGVALQLDRGGIRAQAPKAAASGAATAGAATAGAATAGAARRPPAAILQVVTADATVTSQGADFIARTCNVD